jgi:integrase
MVTKPTKRRSRGDGSVYQSKSGKWVAAIGVGTGIDGKRKRSTRITKSEVLASKALREMHIRKSQNDLLSNQRKTLNQVGKQWIEVGISEKVRQSTANGYIDIYDRYIKPYLGHRSITEIDVNEIDSWLLHLKSIGLSASTRKKARQTCNTIFKFAIRKRVALQNPVIDSQVPANEPGYVTQVQPPLTLKESKSYLEYFRDTELDLLIYLSLFTGMRRGEIIGLNWSDIDLDALTLTINRTAKETTLKRKDGTSKTELVLNPPKTSHSKRTIPVHPPVLLALKRQQNKQRKQKLKAGEAWQETDAVFTTEFGTRSYPSNIYKRYRKLHADSGLRYVRPHDLRHTVAVLGLDAEIPVEVISRLLGHSTISVTMDIYGKSVQSLVNRGAEGISTLLKEHDKADLFSAANGKSY